MEWLKVVLILFCSVVFITCKKQSLSSFDNKKINALLSYVDENSEAFIQKDIQFDSIATLAGSRILNSKSEPLKIKLFYYGDLARGYFNLVKSDSKNLQIFGKKIEGYWAYKCVTKINMDEAGGYMILDEDNRGIWSNGHINFEKGNISLKRQNTDYNSLTNW